MLMVSLLTVGVSCFIFQVILNCSALQSLLHLLSSPKESIKKEACWTISNITAGNRAQIQVCVRESLHRDLVEMTWTLSTESLSCSSDGDRCRTAASSHHDPASSRVPHTEGGGLGHHQRHLWRLCRADQVRMLTHIKIDAGSSISVYYYVCGFTAIPLVLEPAIWMTLWTVLSVLPSLECMYFSVILVCYATLTPSGKYSFCVIA